MKNKIVVLSYKNNLDINSFCAQRFRTQERHYIDLYNTFDINELFEKIKFDQGVSLNKENGILKKLCSKRNTLVILHNLNYVDLTFIPRIMEQLDLNKIVELLSLNKSNLLMTIDRLEKNYKKVKEILESKYPIFKFANETTKFILTKFKQKLSCLKPLSLVKNSFYTLICEAIELLDQKEQKNKLGKLLDRCELTLRRESSKKRPIPFLSNILRLKVYESVKNIFLDGMNSKQKKKAIKENLKKVLKVEKIHNNKKVNLKTSKIFLTNKLIRYFIKIENALKNNEKVLLLGAPGVGKTMMIQELANFHNKKLVVINCNANSDPEELLKKVTKSFTKNTYSQIENVIRKYTSTEFLNKKLDPLLAITHILSKNLDNNSKIELLNLKESLEVAYIDKILEENWVLFDEANLAPKAFFDCFISKLQSDAVIFFSINPPESVNMKFDLEKRVKKELTEIFVDDDYENESLEKIILFVCEKRLRNKEYNKRYLRDALALIVNFYLFLREINTLKRQFVNLRTLVRAINFSLTVNIFYGLHRSLFEGFRTIFILQLSNLKQYINQDNNIITKENIENQFRQSFLDLAELHSIPDCINTNILPNLSYENVIVYENIILPFKKEESIEKSDYIETTAGKRKLLDILHILSGRTTPILIKGETATGKTSLVKHISNILNKKLFRMNCHASSDASDYFGMYMVNINGQFIYKTSPFMKAVKNGEIILLDEINLAPNEVLESLNRLLDDNKELKDPYTGEIIKAPESLVVFATMNPTKSGYNDRNCLGEALQSRFVTLDFSEIEQKEIKEVIEKKYSLPEAFVTYMLNVRKKINIKKIEYDAIINNQDQITLRDIFRWANRKPLDWHTLLLTGFFTLSRSKRTNEAKLNIAKILMEFHKLKSGYNTQEDIIKFLENELRKHLENKYHNYFQKITQICNTNHFYTNQQIELLILQIIDTLMHKEPVLLVGKTAMGKTMISTLVSMILNLNCNQLNCYKDIDTSDFLGTYKFNVKKYQLLESLKQSKELIKSKEIDDFISNENVSDSIMCFFNKNNISYQKGTINEDFLWLDGPLTRSYKNGDIFLIDEISLADCGILERMNSVFEEKSALYLYENTSLNDIVLKPHKNYGIISTMNPCGDYGKKELSTALRNRFSEIFVQISFQKEFYEEMFFLQLEKRLVQTFNPIIRKIMNKICLTNNLRTLNNFINFLNKNSSKIMELAFVKEKEKNIMEVIFNAYNLYFNTLELKENYLIKETCEELRSSDKFFRNKTTHKNSVKFLMASLSQNSILIEGPPACGKTSLVKKMAFYLDKKLITINLSENTDFSDLIGKEVIETNTENFDFGFKWKNGPLLSALKFGYWILIDEINLASQSVLEGLNSILDFRKMIYIPEIDERIECHDQFKIIGTLNPFSLAFGRKGLPDSFINRFINLKFDDYKKEDLNIVLKNISRSQELINYFKKYKNELCCFSIRDFKKASKLIELNSPKNLTQFLDYLFGDPKRFNKKVIVSRNSFNFMDMKLTSKNDSLKYFKWFLNCDFIEKICKLAVYGNSGTPLIIKTNSVFTTKKLVKYYLKNIKIIEKSCQINYFCTKETDNFDLIGSYDLEKPNFINEKPKFCWKNGIVTTACLKGFHLIIENIEECEKGVLDRLNQLYEDNTLTLFEKSNSEEVEVLVPNSKFRTFIITKSDNAVSNAFFSRSNILDFQFYERDVEFYCNIAAKATITKEKESFDSTIRKARQKYLKNGLNKKLSLPYILINFTNQNNYPSLLLKSLLQSYEVEKLFFIVLDFFLKNFDLLKENKDIKVVFNVLKIEKMSSTSRFLEEIKSFILKKRIKCIDLDNFQKIEFALRSILYLNKSNIKEVLLEKIFSNSRVEICQRSIFRKIKDAIDEYNKVVQTNFPEKSFVENIMIDSNQEYDINSISLFMDKKIFRSKILNILILSELILKLNRKFEDRKIIKERIVIKNRITSYGKLILSSICNIFEKDIENTLKTILNIINAFKKKNEVSEIVKSLGLFKEKLSNEIELREEIDRNHYMNFSLTETLSKKNEYLKKINLLLTDFSEYEDFLNNIEILNFLKKIHNALSKLNSLLRVPSIFLSKIYLPGKGDLLERFVLDLIFKENEESLYKNDEMRLRLKNFFKKNFLCNNVYELCFEKNPKVTLQDVYMSLLENNTEIISLEDKIVKSNIGNILSKKKSRLGLLKLSLYESFLFLDKKRFLEKSKIENNEIKRFMLENIPLNLNCLLEKMFELFQFSQNHPVKRIKIEDCKRAYKSLLKTIIDFLSTKSIYKIFSKKFFIQSKQILTNINDLSAVFKSVNLLSLPDKQIFSVKNNKIMLFIKRKAKNIDKELDNKFKDEVKNIKKGFVSNTENMMKIIDSEFTRLIEKYFILYQDYNLAKICQETFEAITEIVLYEEIKQIPNLFEEKISDKQIKCFENIFPLIEEKTIFDIVYKLKDKELFYINQFYSNFIENLPTKKNTYVKVKTHTFILFLKATKKLGVNKTNYKNFKNTYINLKLTKRILKNTLLFIEENEIGNKKLLNVSTIKLLEKTRYELNSLKFEVKKQIENNFSANIKPETIYKKLRQLIHFIMFLHFYFESKDDRTTEFIQNYSLILKLKEEVSLKHLATILICEEVKKLSVIVESIINQNLCFENKFVAKKYKYFKSYFDEVQYSYSFNTDFFKNDNDSNSLLDLAKVNFGLSKLNKQTKTESKDENKANESAEINNENTDAIGFQDGEGENNISEKVDVEQNQYDSLKNNEEDHLSEKDTHEEGFENKEEENLNAEISVEEKEGLEEEFIENICSENSNDSENFDNNLELESCSANSSTAVSEEGSGSVESPEGSVSSSYDYKEQEFDYDMPEIEQQEIKAFDEEGTVENEQNSQEGSGEELNHNIQQSADKKQQIDEKVEGSNKTYLEIKKQQVERIEQLCKEIIQISQNKAQKSFVGYFKSGKKLSLKKVIQFFASNFQKTNIWFRKKSISHLSFQVSLYMDNSASMLFNTVDQKSIEVFVILNEVFSRINKFSSLENRIDCSLETFKFGSAVEKLNCDNMFSDLKFSGESTNWNTLIEAMQQECVNRNSTNNEKNKLILVVSDGRITQNKLLLKKQVSELQENNERCLIVFILLENDKSKISELKSVKFIEGRLEIEYYLENFPFHNYMLVENVCEFPIKLCSFLNQWLQSIN